MLNLRTRLILILLLSACCLTSCLLQPLRRNKTEESKLPESYAFSLSDKDPEEKWWEVFQATDLNQLLEEAFVNNFNLREAWARLSQAEALASRTGSSRFPTLSLDADTSYTRSKSVNDETQVVTRTSVKNYSLGLISSYELDLWGGIRSEYQAANLSSKASREDIKTAAITLAGEVSSRWINIISQRMQKAVLEEQLKINNTYLELMELRYRKSMAPALDVLQQKQVVAQIEARIPLIESQEQVLMHELALLLGKPPREPLEITTSILPEISAPPATGLPANILERRPDVEAAWLRLREADWEVVVARADRLPAVTISAGGSYGAAKKAAIFDNWTTNLAAGLVGPIFDGNRRKAEVERVRAVAEEKLLAYQRTVLTAVKEVEDALIRESKQRQHIELLENQLDLARKALVEARDRYGKGISDYLPVLNELLKMQSLELDILQKRTNLLIYRIDLYRALGASWVDDLDQKGIIENDTP